MRSSILLLYRRNYFRCRWTRPLDKFSSSGIKLFRLGPESPRSFGFRPATAAASMASLGRDSFPPMSSMCVVFLAVCEIFLQSGDSPTPPIPTFYRRDARDHYFHLPTTLIVALPAVAELSLGAGGRTDLVTVFLAMMLS